MKKIYLSLLSLAMLALHTDAYAQAVSGKVTTAPPAYANGAISPLSLDTAGNLRMTCISGCSASVGNTTVVGPDAPNTPDTNTGPIQLGAIFNSTSTLATSGNVVQLQTDNRAQLKMALGASNGANTAQVNLPNTDSLSPASQWGLTTLGLNYVYNGSTWERVRNAGTVGSFAIGGVTASGTANAGSPVKIGGVYNSALPSLTSGDVADLQLDSNGRQRVILEGQLPAGTNTIGSVTLAGGTSAFSLISAASTNATLVKAGGATLYEISLANLSTTQTAYLKLYNTGVAPTCGSGTPVGRYLIPFAASGGAGSNVSITVGKDFGGGLGFCITAGIGDADTTAVAANAVLVNLTYK